MWRGQVVAAAFLIASCLRVAAADTAPLLLPNGATEASFDARIDRLSHGGGRYIQLSLWPRVRYSFGVGEIEVGSTFFPVSSFNDDPDGGPDLSQDSTDAYSSADALVRIGIASQTAVSARFMVLTPLPRDAWFGRSYVPGLFLEQEVGGTQNSGHFFVGGNYVSSSDAFVSTPGKRSFDASLGAIAGVRGTSRMTRSTALEGSLTYEYAKVMTDWPNATFRTDDYRSAFRIAIGFITRISPSFDFRAGLDVGKDVGIGLSVGIVARRIP